MNVIKLFLHLNWSDFLEIGIIRKVVIFQCYNKIQKRNNYSKIGVQVECKYKMFIELSYERDTYEQQKREHIQ